MNDKEQFSQILENLLFPKIFRTFRMSIQPTKLMIAFLAMAIICLAGRIMDVTNSVVVGSNGDSELEIYMTDPDHLVRFIEQNEGSGERTGVFSTLWDFAAMRFHNMFKGLFALDLPAAAANIADYLRGVRWALKYHLLYCVIFMVIKLAVISVAGGAICRIAALQFAQGEKPGFAEAVTFSARRFKNLFAAPLLPVGISACVGLFVFLVGVAGNIRWFGELIMGIAMPLALIAGAIIAAILIGGIGGFNLMFPAVAYDGADCFDAMNQAIRYIYKKPWRMGFYTAMAAVYGSICYMFVRFFAFLLLLATHWLLHLGVWVENSEAVNKLAAVWPKPSFMYLRGSSELATSNWTQSLAAFLVWLSVLVIVGLVASFIISFYFSANTVIYALMRKRVDDTNFEEVYTPCESLPGASANES